MNPVPCFLFHLSRFAGLTCALALSAATLSAAEASASRSAPAKNVLSANAAKEPAGTIGWKNDSVANQWTGITFNVSKALTLDKISLAYAVAGKQVAGASVTLRLIQLDLGGSFAERINQGKVLRTDTFALPATLPDSGWLTFDITDTVLAASPVAYGYILSFDEQAGGRFFSLVRGTGEAKGAIMIGESNAVFRSETGEGGYAALGNTREGTAAFPHVVFVGEIAK